MSSIGGTSTTDGPSSSTTDQAKEKATEKAQATAQQARRGVRDQVDQRSTQAGEQVSSMAQDARSVAEELRNQGKEQPAKLAEQAAQRAESLGGYLQRADGDTILRDIEDFGRRQPWTVIAGGLALGFAASRFLKASSERRYEQQYSRPSPALSTNGAPTTRTALTPADVSGANLPTAGADLPTTGANLPTAGEDYGATGRFERDR
jgi:hypothetical protein